MLQISHRIDWPPYFGLRTVVLLISRQFLYNEGHLWLRSLWWYCPNTDYTDYCTRWAYRALTSVSKPFDELTFSVSFYTHAWLHFHSSLTLQTVVFSTLGIYSNSVLLVAFSPTGMGSLKLCFVLANAWGRVGSKTVIMCHKCIKCLIY